jgi:hypothetical protein
MRLVLLRATDMTLKPEENLLMQKVKEAKSKAQDTIGSGCTPAAHSAVVELITFEADLTQLIFFKLDAIYESISNIEHALDQRPATPLTWSDAAKGMAVRAPYALAVIVVSILLWFWHCGVTPDQLVGQ